MRSFKLNNDLKVAMEHKIRFSSANRLPKLYIHAARILKTVKTEGKGLKNTLYAHDNSHVDIQRCGGLVTKALEHTLELDKMHKFIKSKYKGEAYFDEHKVCILITQLVWGLGALPNTKHDLLILLNQYEKELLDMANSTSNEEKLKVALPRYARINVLKTTENHVLNHLASEGWVEQNAGTSYSTYLKYLAKLKEPYFIRDFHYPEILAFPATTRLFNHPLCKENALLLQAKATCVPVKLLNPRPGSVVLDMCAAPGMKTSQLAAHMNDIGVIHAVEQDPARYATLEQILKNSGVTCAKTYNNDALSIKPDYFSDVTHILVDPSCSGSGMDRVEMAPKTEEQVKNLSKFQFRILCKAMSFSSVRRIVYSTCSVFEIENEAVVANALAYHENNFKLVDAWPDATKGELTRGSSSYLGGELTIYFLPKKDFSTGFFVAVIERVSKKKEKKKNKEDVNKETSVDIDTDQQFHTEDQEKKKSKYYNGATQCHKELKNVEEVEADLCYPSDKKEKKKKKKQDSVDYNSAKETEYEDTDQHYVTDVKEKKKKKKHNTVEDLIASEDIAHADLETQQQIPCDVKEKKKKKKKHSLVDGNGNEEAQEIEDLSGDCQISTDTKEKKKKKKHNTEEDQIALEDVNQTDLETDQQIPCDVKEKKKKKKKKHSLVDGNGIEHAQEIEDLNEEYQISTDVKEKKKKKKQNSEQDHIALETDLKTDLHIPCDVKEKKKKKHSLVDSNGTEQAQEIQNLNVDCQISTDVKEKKKKKKHNTEDCNESSTQTQDDLEETNTKKNKKKQKERQEYLDSLESSHKSSVKSKKRKIYVNENTYENLNTEQESTTETYVSEKKKDKKKKQKTDNVV